MWPYYEVSGEVAYYDNGKQDNYSQPRVFYREVLDEGGRERLINNLATTLKNCAEEIWNRAVSEFGKVDEGFGTKLAKRIRQGLHASV